MLFEMQQKQEEEEKKRGPPPKPRTTHCTGCNGKFKARGFQKFNGIPGVEFFISLGFAEPTTHVIQARFYIR